MDAAPNANQAADNAAYPYPAGVLPPEHEQTDTTGTTTTSGTTTENKSLSPVQVEAEKGQDVAAEGTKAAIGEQTEQKKREAAINADIARRQELAGEGFANETEKAYAETQKMIDAGRARAAVAQQRLDNTPPAQFFHHGDTWGNVLRGFGLALGGVGDAMQTRGSVAAGHGIPTLDTVGQIINSDLDRQRKNIEQMKDSVVMARTGIKDAVEARQQMLQDIELRGAAAYQQLERIGRARLAAQGMSQPDIDAHAAIAAVQEKRAEQHAKYVEPLYQTISQHIEEAKRKDKAVTDRAKAIPPTATLTAPQDAEDFKTYTGYTPGYTEAITPRGLLDPQAQQAEDAGARLKAKVIGDIASKRSITNEAAGKIWDETFGRRPGDSPEALSAKANALGQYLNANSLGQFGRQMTGQPTAPPTAPVAPAAAPAAVARPAAPAPKGAAAAEKPLDRAGYLRALSAELAQARKRGNKADEATLKSEIAKWTRGG